MVASTNPLSDWQVNRADIAYIGHELQRPECILAERDGTLWSADARGGVMRIAPDGTQSFIGQTSRIDEPAEFDARYVQTSGSLPNGLCFDAQGDFLIANFGTDALEHMGRDGRSRTLLDRIDGQPLGKANFVTRDRRGRIWLTVTTRTNPWTDAVRTKVHDGYIALIDDRGARIVADGLCTTNELRFDADEHHIYVAETAIRRVTRWRVGPDGTLSQKESFGPSVLPGTPDGIAFDAHGNLWTTLVMNEKLVAITPSGDVLTLLDDSQPGAAEYDRADAENRLTPEIMLACKGSIAPWMASVTFGGPDLRNVYLGSLLGTRIPWFRSPVPGLPPIHWQDGKRA
ncbi:MAG: SMP-30/gluconolactonase/LRE family protein [Sphingomonas sp.]|uniref:SMP-30/gluconolactonase/LRE family protein n=1 Tax=Sphingomonas sp. TaxID=28214 RepID=UPI00260A163F|nr:SMP-30/gluconolactonase/LRE family protein [Sphingomonas sp.]MDK2770007.1 SMP-30/gluconolactonase/LRE family protein [Sphingomonas sp.]